MSASCLKMFPAVRGSLWKLSNYNSANARYYWRRSAFSELSSAVQTIENNMRQMDRLFDDVQRSRPIRFPRIFFPFEDRTREVPVITTSDGSRTFRLELDVEGMDPENINVTVNDQELIILAKREDKRRDGSMLAKENRYHYTLPSEVNPEAIRSSFVNGVLTIEAPLPALEAKEIPVNVGGAPLPASEAKEIPVNVGGASKKDNFDSQKA